MIRIAVVHNWAPADASAADRDVLVQAAAVSESLRRLGHEPAALDATLNLESLRRRLAELGPDVVFNLVESLDGSDWLALAAAALFDAMSLPYTGAPTEALLLTNHKLLAKEQLRRASLPTPDWLAGSTAPCGFDPAGAAGFVSDSPYILKAVTEHASIGLEDDCVATPSDADELRRQVQDHADRLGRPSFAERYIDGREFNLSLLASPEGAEVLPHAEIDFSRFPRGKPRIVGRRAKWDDRSFEFHHTPRTFDFPEADRPLLTELGDLARACWRLFGLRGYARVDFRVDALGQPWILEVNSNPCLSPDAGFAAALERASIPFDEAVRRILDDSMSADRRLAPGRTTRRGANSPAPA